jgi:hypothetical protein
MKVHVLRAESITPIGIYLDRSRENPVDFECQLELAVVLLYREREYRAIHSSRWLMTGTVAEGADDGFAPYGLTPEAAAILTAVLLGTASGTRAVDAPQRDDLFGLKAPALEGLVRTLRPSRSHAVGWLIRARLLTDLCRYREALDAAEQAVDLGKSLPGLALIYQASLLGAVGPGVVPDGETIARQATRRAGRLERVAGRPRWADAECDALDERIRRYACRIRSRVEGRAFTRFLATELQFCRQERETSLASFDDSRVPAGLAELIPLARCLGVGDDSCRALFMRRMPAHAQRAAAQRIRERAAAISQWLMELGPPPYHGEAAAFFWLLDAADTLQ